MQQFLFSDILVVPRAMGIHVELKDNLGPIIPNPIRTSQDVEKVFVPDVNETLGYVFDAIKLTKQMLNDEVPLIGFAGSPWTIFCYAVEGKGSKSFDTAKGFCFSNPVAAHVLLQKITDTTILYLKEKVKAGCNAIQIFDSWGGMLISSGLSRILISIHQPNCGSFSRNNSSYYFRKRMLVCVK